MITAFYLAILSIIYLALTFYVISIRRTKLISLGANEHLPLEKAVRAHGNFIEYSSLFVIMMYFAEIQNTKLSILHIIGLSFTIGRIFHLMGIIKPSFFMKFRVLGMIMTLINYIALISILLTKNLSVIF